MRFSDGVWRTKEGVKLYPAVEVGKVSTSIKPDKEYWHPFRDSITSSAEDSQAPFIRALCHTQPVVNPGGTLGKATITMTMSSPMEGVIGFECHHFAGRPPHRPVQPDLFPHGKPEGTGRVELSQRNDQLQSATLITAGNALRARLDCGPTSFGVELDRPGHKTLTKIGPNSLQFALNSASHDDAFEVLHSLVTGGDLYHREPRHQRKGFMSVALDIGVGEQVYGFGERFGPFVKNGQSLELTNGDGGTSTALGYKNVPFYMTNHNYGVYFDHTEPISFEVQSDTMTKVQAAVEGECIRFYIIAGSSPKEILERYTLMTGRPPLPPDWSFGLWLSTSFLTKYDEVTVMGIIDRMKTEDIPLSVFHFDCFWSPAHEWCSFRWDPRNFPDPKGFIDRIHAKGVKVCVWINPFVAQESRLFHEGDEKGYFLRRKNGATFQTNDWQAGLAYVDFTNKEAVDWWSSYLIGLVETGVDTFKTDFGEKIPDKDVVWHDNSDPLAMHNRYSLLYNQVVQKVLIKTRGLDQACLFARAATVGSQRFPVHWGGDCDSEWTGMAESVRGGLSLTLSGFPYWAHDIGGFKAAGAAGGYALVTPDADVYKRWVPFGLLSSHSRLHGSGSYRVPWIFGDEACKVLQKFTKLKHRLDPYITDLSVRDASQRGLPLMRAMFLEFPDDRTCWNLDTQYMFGDKLLVAPIFSSKEVEYYVPEAGGDWTNILDGSIRQGGRWYKEECDMLHLPVLLRPNTVLIIGRVGHLFGQKLVNDGVTVVYGAGAKVKLRAEVHLRGETAVSVSVEIGEDGRHEVKVDGLSRGVRLEVVIIGNGNGLDDEALTASGEAPHLQFSI